MDTRGKDPGANEVALPLARYGINGTTITAVV